MKIDFSWIKFDWRSVRFRLWLSFLFVGIGIIVAVWIFQLVSVDRYYESMKIAKVKRVADSICESFRKNDDSLSESIAKLSESDDIYVMMEYAQSDKPLTFVLDSQVRAPIARYQQMIPTLKNALNNSPNPDKPLISKYSDSFEDYKTVAYAKYLDRTKGSEIYLYVFSPLFPVASTLEILKTQLIYITVIVLALTFFIALLFSVSISKPLRTMATSAKKMGKGNYDVKFSGNSYSEINNLASTLNTAAKELGLMDTRQKDLIANVSHDLKTPLTMIKSYAEMIQDISGNNPKKREEHLKVIISEADRMSNLVSDMSTISALRNDKLQLKMSTFNLSSMTSSIVDTHRLLDKNQDYNFLFEGPENAYIYADENRIHQVVANLVSNAVKYCGKDMLVEVKIKATGKFYRLEVSDHGPGISEEDLPLIWERYYKASSNYVRPATGTGLGLSIVKDILSLHDFDYGVESTLGEGTTFWVKFPMAKK